MRIVFMGTPEISTYSLNKILESKHEIVGVVTATDKPAGRGRKIQQSDVKKFAIKNELKVFQPEKLKNKVFLDELKALNADLFVVIAFRMLPKEVWQMPKLGTINLHASLLPQYRGAAPINWAIINGEKETGVTTFFIDEKIDTGKIILQQKIDISKYDTAGSLHDKIMTKGAEALIETINLIEKGKHKTIDQQKFVQNNKQLKQAPKIFKDDCKINWDKNLETIYNFIRGLNPYPGAWCFLEKEDKHIFAKIFDVETEEKEHNYANGDIISDKKSFKIAVTNGFLKVNKFKLEGKKTLSADEFVRGFDLNNCRFI